MSVLSDFRWLPMIAALAAAFLYFGMVMQGKTRLLFVSQHRRRLFQQLPTRLANVFIYAFGQKKMFKEKKAGYMHAFIFWGFMVLQIRTVYLIWLGFDPTATVPFIHHGYNFAKDITELVVLAMVCYAAYRRLVVKPKRLTLSGEAVMVLGMIGGLMVSDFLLDGFAFALAQKDVGFEAAMFFDWGTMGDKALAIQTEMAAAPVGGALAGLFSGMDASTLVAWQELMYWAHIFIVLTFLNLLPGSKHFHVLTAIPNVFFADLKHKGALEPILDLEERETFGVGDVKDFTWNQYLDLYSCTECGRCEVNCPTTITGKTLSPKRLITSIRDHLYSREKELLAGDRDLVGWEVEGHGKSLIDDVSYAAIWDCTTCRACTEACPVMIDHVDKVIDLRRHLTLMEANFPQELGQTLKNLENKGNPWGLPASDRVGWAEGLDVPMLSDNPDADTLFWVGCAGAYDDRQKKVSRAMVQIMNKADVNYGILGNEEGCSGDPARRAGNEYLFQMQAQQNIETFNSYGLNAPGKKKIVTHCPHCFNTMKNEYPQFGGNYEVVHHSEFIDDLIKTGRIKPSQKPAGIDSITYHDSCYIGRYNDVYEQPRNVLKAIPGLQVKEMDRNRTTGMCCGAGGSRAWMEEHDGDRINHVRLEQVMETGAETVAVACPFCNMMMEDAIGAKQATVKSRDIAELVAESIA